MLVSMSENRTRVCVDTNSYTFFNFAWGMLKTRVSVMPPEFRFIEDMEVFFFFFFSTLSLSSFWTSRGHRCHPFSSPVLAFNFYRA